jgi:hypothetical protein
MVVKGPKGVMINIRGQTGRIEEKRKQWRWILRVLQKVDFCHLEEHSDEKSLSSPRDFSLRSK